MTIPWRWPEYSSRRISIATNMAGNMPACWIAISVPRSSTTPAHSSAIAAKLGMNIEAVISQQGAQPWPR